MNDHRLLAWPRHLSEFRFGGGETGCLLVHGLCGSPEEMLLLGQYLAGHGYSALGVQLAGHGTDRDQASRTDWQAWFDSVHEGYSTLAQDASRVFAVGHSTGAMLSLLLAATVPAAGVVALAPIAYLRRWQRFLVSVASRAQGLEPLLDQLNRAVAGLYPSMQLCSIRAYLELSRLLEHVPPELSKVQAPVLIVHGGRDVAVPSDSAAQLARMLSSVRPEVAVFPAARHRLMVEAGREAVWARVLEFLVGARAGERECPDPGVRPRPAPLQLHPFDKRRET